MAALTAEEDMAVLLADLGMAFGIAIRVLEIQGRFDKAAQLRDMIEEQNRIADAERGGGPA